MRWTIWRSLACGAALMLAACGGDEDDGGGGSTVTIAAATPSGTGQTAPAGSTLPEPLRVVVTDAGVPAAGQNVVWSSAVIGVTFDPQTSVTGADGIASTTWTLSEFIGSQTALGSLSGANGSPVAFAATATTPPNTIFVSNNLFNPATLTVSAGTEVDFRWSSTAVNHNVTPSSTNPAAIPASPGLPGIHNAPFLFSVVFPNAGTFRFFCSVHGFELGGGTVGGMSGTVTVTP